jgi:hypothetical protein
LPARHVEVDVRPFAFFSVDAVSVTSLSDPVDALTRVLALPLRELYAVLVRAGVVDAVETVDAGAELDIEA